MGQEISIWLILRDITVRDKVEAEMRKFTMAVEQSGSAIIITDPDGCIEYVNPKFTTLSGYSLDEVRGLKARIFKSGHQDQVFYENMWSIIKSGKTWKGELLNRKKNETLYWEEAIISAVFDTDGHLTDIVAAKEDISERKAIENREKEQREFTEALLDTTAAINSTLGLKLSDG